MQDFLEWRANVVSGTPYPRNPVLLGAFASIPFLLLVSLPGTCTVFLTSWALQQMAGAEGAMGSGRSRGGLCDAPCAGPGAFAVADEGVEA